MGGRYFLFRASYEMRRKSGLLRLKYPVNYRLQKFLSLEEWKEKAMPFFFDSSKEVSLSNVCTYDLAFDFQRVIKGECCFFSSEWYNLGADYDWVTNPDTNYKYDVSKHWTEVEDIVQEAGDIKYVWEKSRFSYLYTVIRYDHSTE
ncbi:heparinase, partial [Bacteroides fragilis]